MNTKINLSDEVICFIDKQIKLNNFCLPHFYPKIDTIEKFQAGYKFNALTTKELTSDKEGEFKKDWIVICSAYADDPFFIDITEDENNFPVYFAWHGAGTWNPIKVAKSITDFSQKLELLKKLESENSDIQEKFKNYFDLTNEFWNEVYAGYTEFGEE